MTEIHSHASELELNDDAIMTPTLEGYRAEMATILDGAEDGVLTEEARKSFDTLAGLAKAEVKKANDLAVQKAADADRMASLSILPSMKSRTKPEAEAFEVNTSSLNTLSPAVEEAMAKAFEARMGPPAPDIGALFVKSASYKAATAGGEIMKGAPIGVDTGVLMKTLFTSPTVGTTIRYGDSTQARFGLLDAITMVPTGRDTIVSHQFTFGTMAAAEVAEGVAKPESALTTTTATLTPKKLAHHIPVTAEALSDHPRMQALINSILVGGVRQAMETTIATDLAAWTGLATSAFNTDMTTSLLDGKIAAEVYRMANGILIGSVDYATLALAGAAADNNYPGPFGPATFTVWGLPVFYTAALPSGFAYVGDLSQVVWNERTGINLAVGWVNTQFTENEVTLLAEARGMLDVMHNLAVVKTDIVTP